MLSAIFGQFSTALTFLTSYLFLSNTTLTKGPVKNLIVDTDFFSDVDDAGALLLASTLPDVNLLAVNINYPSSYSALAVAAVLNHYGKSDVPIGIRRPLTNDSFFDTFSYNQGEFASKVAYQWTNNSMRFNTLDSYWEPVDLYRKILAEQKDGSVTIASIGFFENLSGLLNSTADKFSPLSGPELISRKVSELVIMGGSYPNGHEYNFWGDNSTLTAHVVNSWKGNITFLGDELGSKVFSGAALTTQGPMDDPVRAAYNWYVGYGNQRESWDPLTMLYTCRGLGQTFEYGVDFGYNYVFPNGSNTWIFDDKFTSQRWLQLKVDNATAGQELDVLFLNGAESRSKIPISP